MFQFTYYFTTIKEFINCIWRYSRWPGKLDEYIIYNEMHYFPSFSQKQTQVILPQTSNKFHRNKTS